MKKVLFLLFLLLLTCPIFVLAKQIDVNTATLSQLDELTGIGPTYAQRIINNRPYSSVDDLLKVKGIGEKTLQKIKDQGLAYVGNSAGETGVATTEETTAVEPTEAINEQAKDAPPIVYATGIVINEILPSPEGADEENEWVELYNSNSSEVNLSGWKIQDVAGTQTTYTIPEGIKILGSSFLVFDRSETKIVLNNTEDGLRLFTPDNKDVDFVSYTKAPLGQSYNKIGSGWQWSRTITPGAKNNISGANSSTISEPNGLPKTENSDKNNVAEAGLAGFSRGAISNQDAENLNPWFLFFTALAITIVSAAAVLFIKIKFKQRETKNAKHNEVNS